MNGFVKKIQTKLRYLKVSVTVIWQMRDREIKLLSPRSFTPFCILSSSYLSSPF